MATIRHINKEAYAAKALELLNARREEFVEYGKKHLSEGEHPDRVRGEIEYKVEKDMEEVLFECLKSRGIVCGDIDELYNKYGSCRRIRLMTDKGDASSNLLNIREVLPYFGEIIDSILGEAEKLLIIAEIEKITKEAKEHNDEV